MSTTDFIEWLMKELNSRDWSQADLARQSGLTTAAISRILTGERNAGSDACQAIAHALGYPPETVYRAAGLLPPKPDQEIEFDEWRHVLSQLSVRDRQELLSIARLKLEGSSESWKTLVDLYDQVPEESQGKAVRDAADVMEEYLKEIGAKRTK